MKKFFFYLFLTNINIICFAQQGNVGVNTDNPAAKLDILTKDNTGTTKGLQINNSSGSEVLTILNNGNVGVNTSNPSSQFEVTAGTNTKSVMKISPLSATNLKQNSSINYNNFSALGIGINGNLLAKSDIRNNNVNAITFDGTYTTAASGANTILCSINRGSIVRFTFHTNFFQGATGVGVVKFADVLWSQQTGFKVISSGHDFGNNNANNLTITGSGTNILTFDVDTGDDFVFEVTGGNLVYRQVNPAGSPKSEQFRILKSFRTR